jgi:hypothetical protein
MPRYPLNKERIMNDRHSSPNPDEFNNRDDGTKKYGYQKVENQQKLQTPPQVLIVLITVMIVVSAAGYMLLRGEVAQKKNLELLKRIQSGLRFHLVKDQAMSAVQLEPVDAANEIVLMEAAAAKSRPASYYKLEKIPALSGEYVKEAGLAKDAIGANMIHIEFDSTGSTLFAELTANNVGNQLAMVYGNRVISAPVIQSRIIGGKAQISGNDIAIILDDIRNAEDQAASATVQAEAE